MQLCYFNEWSKHTKCSFKHVIKSVLCWSQGKQRTFEIKMLLIILLDISHTGAQFHGSTFLPSNSALTITMPRLRASVEFLC